jgi:hypothetical protein
MKGWECPKCGQCFAPHIDRCPDCVSVTTIEPLRITPLIATPPGVPGLPPTGPTCISPRTLGTVSANVVNGSRLGLGPWASHPTDS